MNIICIIPKAAKLITLLFLIGCQDEYYSMDDFSSVKKIDAHVHVNTTDPMLMDLARESNYRLITVNLDGFFNDYSIVQQRETASELTTKYPGKVAYLTTFSLEGWDNPEVWLESTITYLEKSFSQGAIGVKLWKNIGMEFMNISGEFVMIDDPQFDPILNYLVKNEKPVLGHIGEPREAWLPLEEMTVHQGYFGNNPQYHMYLHPEYPSYEDIILSRNNMLIKHPNLKFIGAHLGSMEWSIDMMAEHLEQYPNMILDMAARIVHLHRAAAHDRDKLRDFMITYQDRLIYSTDIVYTAASDTSALRNSVLNRWMQDWEFFVTDNQITAPQINDSFRGLRLPVNVIDKIFRFNAEKWYPGI